MYTEFENKLQKEFGIDFNSYLKAMRVAGNETGIYADVALLLCRMVSLPQVDVVLELGSGMSTCVLAKVKDNCKAIHSIEHLEKWYGITKKCMDSLSLNNHNYVCTRNSSDNAPLIGKVDLVWIDGAIGDFFGDTEKNRLYSCDYYADSIVDAIWLFDDCNFFPGLLEWLDARNRKGNVVFNPTGRGDRHVMVSLSPDYEHRDSVLALL